MLILFGKEEKIKEGHETKDWAQNIIIMSLNCYILLWFFGQTLNPMSEMFVPSKLMEIFHNLKVDQNRDRILLSRYIIIIVIFHQLALR